MGDTIGANFGAEDNYPTGPGAPIPDADYWFGGSGANTPGWDSAMNKPVTQPAAAVAAPFELPTATTDMASSATSAATEGLASTAMAALRDSVTATPPSWIDASHTPTQPGIPDLPGVPPMQQPEPPPGFGTIEKFHPGGQPFTDQLPPNQTTQSEVHNAVNDHVNAITGGAVDKSLGAWGGGGAAPEPPTPPHSGADVAWMKDLHLFDSPDQGFDSTEPQGGVWGDTGDDTKTQIITHLRS